MARTALIDEAPPLRQVTWGQALYVKVTLLGPGLRPVLERITEIVGPSTASRPTYAKLFTLDRAPSAGTRDCERAWQLLTVLGENPTEWGIDEAAMSPATKGVRDLLFAAIACSSDTPADRAPAQVAA